MAASTNLVRLYLGAGYSPSGARKAGSSMAQISSASQTMTRQRLLTEALRKKRLKPEDLGPRDAAIMGLSDAASPNLAQSKVGGLGGIFGKIGGGIANLTSDVYQAGKQFFPGMYEIGKAGLQDSLLGAALGVNKPGSQLKEKVVDPTVEGYKYMYGPAFSGDFGKTLSRMYENPLQPILDVATVGSLGLGSAARVGGFAARTGAEGGRIAELGSKAARLTSPEGRPGLRLDDSGDNVLPRDYSTAPLRRISQQVYDKTADAIPKLGSFQKKRAVNLDLRRQGALEMAQTSQNVERAIVPIAMALKDMDADETMAFSLLTRGVNDAETLQKFQDSVGKAMRNEHEGEFEGRNFDHFEELGADRDYAQRFLELSPRTQQLIMDPAQSPAILRTAQLWNQNVQRMKESGQLDTEAIENLKERRREELGDGAEDPVVGTDYMPDMLAKGFVTETPGWIARMAGRKKGQSGVKLEKQQYSPRTVTAQNLLSTSKRSFADDSAMDTFMAGMFRTDGRALLDHIARRERDIVENGFNQQLILDYGLRDEDGDLRTFKRTGDVPKGYVLIHDKFPVQWFQGEYNMLQGMMDRVHALKLNDFDEDSPEAFNDLMAYQEKDAQAFVASHWSALKQPGYAIPRDVFDYQMKLATVNDPYRYAGANWLARAMHRWRTATLAYMPRWALNTAVGSFVLAMIKGVVRPGDYMTANRINRTFTDPAGNRIVAPSKLGRRAGKSAEVLEGALGRGVRDDYLDEEGNLVTLPENPADRLLEPIMPAGVSLKSVAMHDYMEPGAVGADYDWIGSRPFSARRIVDFVQSSEDFFRRAHFVKNLRGEAKQLMRDRGESLKEFYRDLDDAPLVEQWLNDPELQRRALEETDKWSYSYGELGPMERRYVRQAIPFWGWYKFITKFAWRLGVDNPGRAQIINQISQIGQDAQDELGLVPPWVRGSIILNVTEGGKLKYLSTAGANPLASFAIPFGPEGAKSWLQMGQASPAIQAWLAWQGYDTLRGGEVPISPMEGIGAGMFGQSVDVNTGQDVDLATRGAGRRALMTPLRSVPQFRMLENYLMGGSVYPESVPFIAPRPMARAEGAEPESLAEAFYAPAFGFNENEMDLKKYQLRASQNAKLAKAKARANLRRIERTTR